jgi:hypothetical protein
MGQHSTDTVISKIGTAVGTFDIGLLDPPALRIQEAGDVLQHI